MSQNTPQQRAKQPRTALAGPYGHPFHPILVTIPIGAWIASLVFDIIGLASDDPEPYVRGAWILIVIGLAGAVLAAIWGFLDYAQLARGTVARRTATIHMALKHEPSPLAGVRAGGLAADAARRSGKDDDRCELARHDGSDELRPGRFRSWGSTSTSPASSGPPVPGTARTSAGSMSGSTVAGSGSSCLRAVSVSLPGL